MFALNLNPSMMFLLIGLSCANVAAINGQDATRPESEVNELSVGKSEIPELEKPFWESAQNFVNAYADRDVEAIGKLFTDDAEFLDELGVRSVGRTAIMQRFEEAFTGSPNALIESISIQSVKYLGESVAIEEGIVVSSQAENMPLESNKYAAIHHKNEDGHWLIAILKDFPREELGRQEQLARLEWMLGDWVNESSGERVETSCNWSDDGNYILRSFKLKTAAGLELSGVQRTGWDPINKKLRSWTFDSEGGFFNGFWTQTSDGWLLTSAGVSSGGASVTSTAIYRIVDSEMLTWHYQNLIVGDEIRHQAKPITMVRRSPKPQLNVSNEQ